MSEEYHIPVLLKESVDGLQVKPDGTYVDLTFGGGGHSREILRRLGRGGRLFCFDQDSDTIANLPDDERLTFIHSNFRFLKNWMRFYGVEHVDGILADLGVSSHHFDDKQRGFSFRFDSALDMRMNRQAGQTAADIVNNYSEQQLADVFYLYGELKQARRIAQAIVRQRAAGRIATTGQLTEATAGVLRQDREKKELARLFQALRIEVNREMEALGDMLAGARDTLAEGGRLSVITYHSLEDRLVKNMMRTGNIEGKVEQDFFGRRNNVFRAIAGKPIVPTDEEQQRNPRSRSAKLRVAEKTAE